MECSLSLTILLNGFSLKFMFVSVHPYCEIFFFFSSRRRHTRCSRDLEFRRVLFRSEPDDEQLAVLHRQLLVVGFDRRTARALGGRPLLADLSLLVLVAAATLIAVRGLGNLLVVDRKSVV